MYRPSDADCDTPDAAPADIKNIPFKLKIDCLSKDASKQVGNALAVKLELRKTTPVTTRLKLIGSNQEWVFKIH